MGSKISIIRSYFPQQVISNEELVALGSALTSEKIETKLGIKQRHVTSQGETSLDLAYNAALRVIEEVGRDKIDFIVLCTQSPDYFLPTSACILQDKLGLGINVGAFDFNLGCSGFVYGLGICKGFISAGIAKSILLVTSETYTKFINPKDISNRSIFGDGAAATLVEYSETEHIHEFRLGTDGKGYDNLIVKAGGFRQPIEQGSANKEEVEKDENLVLGEANLYMNGPEIFNFTIASIPNLVNDCLQKNSIQLEEVDYFIFHQANKYMLEYLRNKCKISPEKFYINMSSTGNTVSATIPIALENAMNNGLIKTGDKVMLCGFGVGYSWGATLITI